MKPHEEKLVVENLNLVPFVFNKYYQQFRRSPDYEDILSLGYIGLIKAAEKFNPSKNNRFSTWAAYHIRSEINTYFKKRKALKREAKVISLDEEVNDKDKERGHYLRERKATNHEAISAPDYRLNNIENKLIAEELLLTLDERERTIIYMYFWLGLSDSQIGKHFKLTRKRISQIINTSLKKLRLSLDRKGIKKSDILTA